jgi:hypothetical protein
MKLTRNQQRQMGKLAEKVSRITNADRLFFERHPDRRHRVRLAGDVEIAEIETVRGLPMDVRPGESIYALVRSVAPGERHRLLAPGPEGAETDLPESLARELFEAALSRGVLHLVIRGPA